VTAGAAARLRDRVADDCHAGRRTAPARLAEALNHTDGTERITLSVTRRLLHRRMPPVRTPSGFVLQHDFDGVGRMQRLG
jgi:hypothetical protein